MLMELEQGINIMPEVSAADLVRFAWGKKGGVVLELPGLLPVTPFLQDASAEVVELERQQVPTGLPPQHRSNWRRCWPFLELCAGV